MPNATDPVIQTISGRRWDNWHHSVGGRVARFIHIWNDVPNRSSVDSYNKTTAALQRIMQEAMDANRNLRGLGGGWSFSPVALTDGVLINTRNLNYQFNVPAHLVHPAYPGLPENLVFAQCGTAIAELNHELGLRSKSLKTSGASNGQTIVGAMSTGTHGSAIDVGAIQDSVVALHIITAPDRQVWLERASQPVLADSFPEERLGADLIRDDATFNAALVSMGSFGLIHGVVIEVEDRFHLQVFRQRMRLDDDLWAALDHLDFSGVTLPRSGGERPYHFQAVFNPHDQDTSPYMTVMYKDTVPAASCKPIERNQKWSPGDDAAAVVGRLTDVASGIVPALAGFLVESQYGEVDGECGTLGEVFTNTTLRGHLASAAVGIPLARVRETLEALRDLHNQEPFPGLFALRYVRGTTATLGFTRHHPQTCILELDAPQSSRTEKFYARAWDRFITLDLPFTFHWGKMQRRDAALTERMYGPQAIQSWQAARHSLLTTPALRRLFTNRMLAELGLGT
jgi:hypothetical protein